MDIFSRGLTAIRALVHTHLPHYRLAHSLRPHGSSDETFNTAAANGASVRAHYSAVQPSALCTTLASERLRVSTVEHLLAALSACRISNLAIRQ